MKKLGILNSHISKVLSDLGHTDMIVIADAGLPVPEGVPKIDLSLKLGTPSFQEIVELIADDMVVEKVILATEIKAGNPEAMQFITEKFGDEAIDVSINHEQFKALTRNAKVVIRTGEATPYANCILQSGVIFG
ncbi:MULTISPECIES: D-ribose pyranase [Paenibacillus]|uniref:D-ribose pyranase n=1 Tax=Paenibacillus TaxID=44249 RepID=UPI00088B9E3E|nr:MULTISPECIES: D-ribose pyranase [Paenibacillus]MCZ1268259.1 D-ribose pyranase [Paenibacillus tundrae]WDQ31383.1 D-ribose pyranase [Paenibacillus marchantiae]SDK56428.1 ribose transport protein RbsD [Paenibacillus sp. OK060]SEA74355.1 D-ribose pyranase [Paenibacillus sp. 276b]SHN61957.1 D-ribose pyranase [Paenibacillus sp. ov031]